MIRLSRSDVGRAEAEAVAQVITQSGYLGMGEQVQAFEEELANFLDVPRQWVVCVSSGTAALHLALQAITRPGDQVLVQSLTYLASFQAISAAGCRPVACEVEPDGLTIDLDDATTKLNRSCKAIMPVHYAGNPGNLEAIWGFARRHGLRCIEDAAHAFGGRYKDRLLGAEGDIVCFSFDGIKNITSGEGGAVVTSDWEVTEQVRDARLLGVRQDTEKRFQGKRSWEFDVVAQGWRYHMSDIMAAVGRVQLRRFNDELRPKRIELAKFYRQLLGDVGQVRSIYEPSDTVVPHIYPILVLDGSRDGLRSWLLDKGIQTGIHYKPAHLLTYFGETPGALPITEKIYEQILTLPLHTVLTKQEVSRVAKEVHDLFAELPPRST